MNKTPSDCMSIYRRRDLSRNRDQGHRGSNEKVERETQLTVPRVVPMKHSGSQYNPRGTLREKKKPGIEKASSGTRMERRRAPFCTLGGSMTMSSSVYMKRQRWKERRFVVSVDFLPPSTRRVPAQRRRGTSECVSCDCVSATRVPVINPPLGSSGGLCK